MAKNPNVDFDAEIDNMIKSKNKKKRKGKKQVDDFDALAELFAAGKKNCCEKKDSKNMKLKVPDESA